MKKINDLWVLEESDIYNRTMLTAEDLRAEFNDSIDQALFETADETYEIAFQAHEMGQDVRHAKAVRYLVENSESHRQAMLEAQIELVKIKVITSADLEMREDGKFFVPPKVMMKLRRGGLYNKGEYFIPELFYG